MPDVKNYGLKGVGSDVQYGKQSGRLTYDTDHFNVRNKTNSAYETIRALDPTHDADLATKLYVDSVAQGLLIKDSVKVATNDLTLVDNNVTRTSDMSQFSWNTTTHKWDSSSNTPTIDGVQINNGDRVLFKDGVAQGGGIFTFNVSDRTFVRATDADNSGLVSSELKNGVIVYVRDGFVWGGTSWVITTPIGVVNINVSNIVWSQFGGQKGVLPTDGLTKDGNYLKVNPDNVTIGIISDKVTVKSSATEYQVLRSEGSGAATWGALNLSSTNSTTGVLPTSRGGIGTDFSSFANGSLIVAGTGELPKGATHEVLKVGISGNLEYGYVDLSTSSGVLPIAKGGTGGSTKAAGATGLGLGTSDSPTFTGLTLSGGAFSANSIDYIMPINPPSTQNQILACVSTVTKQLSWITPDNQDPGEMVVKTPPLLTGSVSKWTSLHNKTTDATVTPLYVNGITGEIPIPDDTTMAFEAKIVGRFNNADESFVFILKGMAVNNSGTVTIYNQGTEIISEQDVDWDATAVASSTNLRINVTGEANKSIQWVALVNTVEVTY